MIIPNRALLPIKFLFSLDYTEEMPSGELGRFCTHIPWWYIKRQALYSLKGNVTFLWEKNNVIETETVCVLITKMSSLNDKHLYNNNWNDRNQQKIS